MLCVHSYFSFKYGVHAPEVLVKKAKAYGYKAMSLTDIHSTAGLLDFTRIANAEGIKAILGIDFRKEKHPFTAIARNHEGFRAMNDYLSACNADIDNRNLDTSNLFIVHHQWDKITFPLKDNEYVGLGLKDLMNKRLNKDLQYRWVPFPEYTLLDPDDWLSHQALVAIDQNTILTKIRPNSTCNEKDVFLTKKEFLSLYAAFPEAIKNLATIVSDCDVDFTFGSKAKSQNITIWSNSEEADYKLLRSELIKGLHKRYPSGPTFAILRRAISELKVIRKQQFLAYFLVTWDMLRYARSKGYFYVGRGSGANSLVAYALFITDVDPVELDLYFERFINVFRSTPPDFDIDFSWADREDVLAYLFDRYENVALLATHSTFQFKSLIRELGKVYGLPPHEIEAVQKGISSSEESYREILQLAKKLHGNPSHLSVHAGGVLIAEHSLHSYTALSYPPKGYPITEFDMLIAEDIGLYKYDLLAQRGLGKIRDTIQMIKARGNSLEVDIHHINGYVNDERLLQNLSNADAIGCFYIESPAMRQLMGKLQVKDYLGLVAASSVIRPGVSQSGMMRTFIERYRNPKKRQEAHPVLLDIMPDTFGVMVYQEDVIKVAHYFAGLDLSEADVLRRGMSGKYRSRAEFQRVKEKFFKNCDEIGHPQEVASDIWRQIESFAGYAFAKGHSASYAVESFQSLYLKTYYPLEFMTAVLNNGGGFYTAEFYVHEAKMKGAEIALPDIQRSGLECVLLDNIIYLGLGMIKNVEKSLIDAILTARSAHGPFKSLENLLEHVDVSLDALIPLIRVGALRSIDSNKKALLWKAHYLLNGQSTKSKPPALFGREERDWVWPKFEDSLVEDMYDEMELLGFSMESPFRLLEKFPSGTVLSKELKDYLHQEVTILGYLVTTKPTKTAQGHLMYFGTFIDIEGRFIDSVHFPPVIAKYPFRGRGVYLLNGQVIEDFDVLSIEVRKMEKLAFQRRPE
jgi:DNA polymerase-3 subunit alpha